MFSLPVSESIRSCLKGTLARLQGDNKTFKFSAQRVHLAIVQVVSASDDYHVVVNRPYNMLCLIHNIFNGATWFYNAFNLNTLPTLLVQNLIKFRTMTVTKDIYCLVFLGFFFCFLVFLGCSARFFDNLLRC